MTHSAGAFDGAADADGLGAKVEGAWRQATIRDLAWQIVLPFTVVVPILVLWELYTQALGNPFVPGPTDVAAALPQVLTGEVLGALAVTNVALFQGYLVAAAVGVLLGLTMGRFRLPDAIFGPYLNLAMVTPMIVLMPVVLMALGLTQVSLIVIVFLFAVPYIAVPTRAGVRTLPTELTDMGRSFGARELQLWREVVLPGAVPFILTGLRLGFGQAVTGIIATELTLIAVGIGRVLLGYQTSFQVDNTFAVTLLIIVECVFVMGALRMAELRQRYRRGS